MNGGELPFLLDALGEWVWQNRDPNTGLVFGATVREPTDEQTVKTYSFACEDDFKAFEVIVWQFGNVNVHTADFSNGTNQPYSEVFYWDEFEFEETGQVIGKLDYFFRENGLYGCCASVAVPDAP